MIPIEHLVSGINLGIAAAMLLGLRWLFWDLRVDKTRDKLFALRDELFDYAIQNNLLRHGSYRGLRESVNSMIRFEHRSSVWVFAAMIIASERIPSMRGPNVKSEWRRRLDDLPQNHRQVLTDMHEKMFIICMVSMIKKSFVAQLALGVVGIVLFAQSATHGAAIKLNARAEGWWKPLLAPRFMVIEDQIVRTQSVAHNSRGVLHA